MNREIILGQTAQISKKITDTDLTLFAAVTGDFNPIHLIRSMQLRPLLKERIAHGMILAGLISAVIGMKQPGQGERSISTNPPVSCPCQGGRCGDCERRGD